MICLAGLSFTLLLWRMNELHQQNRYFQKIVINHPTEHVFHPESSLTHSPNKNDLFIQKIDQLIDENISNENLNTALICRELGMSRSQVYKKIKSHKGESLSKIIREKRMRKAVKLLKSTNLPVSEIAFLVGFKDPCYFSRVFALEHGKTPREMRS